MVQAYVLISTKVGSGINVAKALKSVEGVQVVDRTLGPYDLIAVVEACDPNAMGNLITERIHTIPGLVRTVTCFSLNGRTEN